MAWLWFFYAFWRSRVALERVPREAFPFGRTHVNASAAALEDLFLEQIADLYDAEQRLVKALPKMAEASTSPELRQDFESHFGETKGDVRRLEQVFQQLRKDPKGQTGDAMREKKANDKLTKLAESKVNQEASRTSGISR